MRQEVVATALRLFLERGFEAVTTTEIAATAGISPRSFFRYFPTKEDVVLFALHDAGEQVRDSLHARPSDEPVWESLRLAFHVLVEAPSFATDDILGVTKMIMVTPSIQARTAQKRQEWEAALLPEITSRLSDHGAAHGVAKGVAKEDRARVLLGTALACVDAATRAWIRLGGKVDAIELFDALMAQIAVA